jgi:hypothetical protein
MRTNYKRVLNRSLFLSSRLLSTLLLMLQGHPSELELPEQPQGAAALRQLRHVRRHPHAACKGATQLHC